MAWAGYPPLCRASTSSAASTTSPILASPFLNMAGMDIPCNSEQFWPVVAMLGVRDRSRGHGGQNTEFRVLLNNNHNSYN